MPLRGREVEAPVSTQRHEELLGGVLYHGSLRGWNPAVSWAHGGGAWVTSHEGEVKTAKIVGDELKVPKANSFAEGESTTQQTFTIDNDGDHRWGNHQNVKRKSML
jgi:hypothetical protein